MTILSWFSKRAPDGGDVADAVAVPPVPADGARFPAHAGGARPATAPMRRMEQVSDTLRDDAPAPDGDDEATLSAVVAALASQSAATAPEPVGKVDAEHDAGDGTPVLHPGRPDPVGDAMPTVGRAGGSGADGLSDRRSAGPDQDRGDAPGADLGGTGLPVAPAPEAGTDDEGAAGSDADCSVPAAATSAAEAIREEQAGDGGSPVAGGGTGPASGVPAGDTPLHRHEDAGAADRHAPPASDSMSATEPPPAEAACDPQAPHPPGAEALAVAAMLADAGSGDPDGAAGGRKGWAGLPSRGQRRGRRSTARLGVARLGAQVAGGLRWLFRMARALRGIGADAPATQAFGLAALAPVPLLLGAAALGGPLPFVALAYMTVFTFTMDELSGLTAPRPAPARAGAQGDGSGGEPGPADAEARAADRLSVVLVGTHLLLLAAAIYALSGGTGLPLAGWIATFLAFGLWFGQVSNANAHELIHRSDPRLRQLGGVVLTSLMFGHHASAHRLVHHRHVATPDDPNSADAGEGFWQFLPRAWTGSFLAGWEMETQMMRARIGARRRRVHPYVLYLGGALAALVAAGLIFGPAGAAVYLGLAAQAQMQLLLSDYVQHYGLLRRRLATGRYEPVGPQHSWDAPDGLSALAMLNAARHGDHRSRPSVRAARLQRSGGTRGPMLPHALPVMCMIAIVPPLWHRMMDPRVAALRPRGDGLRI